MSQNTVIYVANYNNYNVYSQIVCHKHNQIEVRYKDNFSKKIRAFV